MNKDENFELPPGFSVALILAGNALDHQMKSGEMLPLEEDFSVEISAMEAFLVVFWLDASFERAARIVTFDVFRKKPRAAA